MKKQGIKQRIIVHHPQEEEKSYYGGAWKLAYADFITALMTFFLLMWLLNSVPSEQLKDVMYYFKFGPIKDKNLSESEQKNHNVSLNPGNKSTMFNDITVQLQNALSLVQMKNNISFNQKDEGLDIVIADSAVNPIFISNYKLTVEGNMIVTKISNIIKYTTNQISIAGYTNKSNDYENNWIISNNRAQEVRKLLELNDIPQERILKTIAYADNIPANINDTTGPENRRVVITLLKNNQNNKIANYKSPIPQ
jgi:chemotaxis protein MotB